MKKIAVGLTALLFPVISFALVPVWKVVPAESKIAFTATQNGSPVKGTFNTFTGEMQGSPTDLKDSHVKIIVDTGSVNTSYGEVATTLKTADWFNVAQFPKAVFTADHFTQTGKDAYSAKGTLTIRDKTVPVTLDFVLKGYSPSGFEAVGSTTIQRLSFGVGQGSWSKTDSIKDNVRVEFTLKASKA